MSSLIIRFRDHVQKSVRAHFIPESKDYQARKLEQNYHLKVECERFEKISKQYRDDYQRCLTLLKTYHTPDEKVQRQLYAQKSLARANEYAKLSQQRGRELDGKLKEGSKDRKAPTTSREVRSNPGING